MKELLFTIFILAIVVGIIYMIYHLISYSSFGKNKKDWQASQDDLLAQITILYKQKKYAIVEYLSKKYLSKRPLSHDVRYIYAKMLFRVKRYYDAIDQARVIVRYQPKNIDSRIFISKCYKETTQLLKAINELKEVLNYDSRNLYALKDLAMLYNQTNQKVSSIRTYRQLEQHYGETHGIIPIKIAVAQVYMDLSQFVNAIDEYKSILNMFPDEINVKKLLVVAYIENRQFTLAVDMLSQLQRMKLSDDDSLWVYENLVSIKMSMGKHKEALSDVKLLLEHPLTDKKKIKAVYARILLATGQVEESIDILNQLIELDPVDILLKKYLANAYLAKKDFPTAIGIYKKVLNDTNVMQLDVKELNHDMSNIYSDWAVWYFDNNDSAKSFDTFVLALQYDNENPDIYHKMAKVNLTIKNYNEAMLNSKKAIERNPKNAEYYLILAKCYSYLENVLDERKALIQAIECNYNNPSAHYRLAIINESQRDLPNAIAHTKMAIELDENFLEAKYKLALLLEAQGQTEEAIATYQAILVTNPNHEPSIKNLNMLSKYSK